MFSGGQGSDPLLSLPFALGRSGLRLRLSGPCGALRVVRHGPRPEDPALRAVDAEQVGPGSLRQLRLDGERDLFKRLPTDYACVSFQYFLEHIKP